MTNEELSSTISALIVERDAGATVQPQIDTLFAEFERRHAVELARPTDEQIAHSRLMERLA